MLRDTFSSTNFRRSRKISKGDYWLCHVCQSLNVEKLADPFTDFNEILNLNIFRKSVKKFRVS